MSAPLVSCIVPVFNGAAYLRAALDSIFAQTHRPLDVVVVDDGSTDETPDLVAAYPQPLRSIRQANAGPSTARNRGLHEARGAFIAFLDADDLWHPDKLALQIALLESRPDVAACVTLIQNFWEQELRDEQEAFRGHPREQPLPGYSSVTRLARRSLFDVIGGFDTRLKHGDDTDWFLRASEAGATVELIPRVLVHRRMHALSRSRQWQDRSRDEYLTLLKTHLDRLRSGRPAPADDDDPPAPRP